MSKDHETCVNIQHWTPKYFLSDVFYTAIEQSSVMQLNLISPILIDYIVHLLWIYIFSNLLVHTENKNAW